MQFLIIESDGKPLRLVSQETISVVKEYNLKRHIKADMKLSMSISEGKKLLVIRGKEIIV